MRKKIIAGNWKMNLGDGRALSLVKDLIVAYDYRDEVEVVVCPPFTVLAEVGKLLKDYPQILLGAQNMHFEESGAFTGEVSPTMLKKLGCTYVIVGHSERRDYFMESNEFINKKIKAAFAYTLTPILCVGETLTQRENGEMEDFIKEELTEGLCDVPANQVAHMIIAYEPIWAIGTGKTATAEQANEACAYIRGVVESLYSRETAEKIRIQYGGSVKGENSHDILTQPHIDGALVGGASLEAKSFIPIIEYNK